MDRRNKEEEPEPRQQSDKVGNVKEENLIGIYGVGNRNEAGVRLKGFSHSNDLHCL